MPPAPPPPASWDVLVLAVVAIGTMPLAAELLSRVFERPLVMGPGAIARIVVTAVVLPFLAVMVVHKLWPRSAERLSKPVRLVASALLVLAIVALLAGTWQAIAAADAAGIPGSGQPCNTP